MKLDENHLIVYDDNNVTLRFQEDRVRIKKDKTEESYLFKEDRYYPNVKSALKSYVNLKLKGSESIQNILDRIDDVELLISKLKTN
jgi:hypothetical protein